MNKPKIYLAGPSVFHPESARIAQLMKNMCEESGSIGLYPLDNEISPHEGPNAKFAMGLAIFCANTEMIDECDAVVADLSPFRGPSADVGTVWEIAYAHGKGKIITGFTTSHQNYRNRVIDNEIRDAKPSRYEKMDEDGLTLDNITYDSGNLSVEDFDMQDNLMITGSICRANKKNMELLLPNGGLSTSFANALHMALERIQENNNEKNINSRVR